MTFRRLEKRTFSEKYAFHGSTEPDEHVFSLAVDATTTLFGVLELTVSMIPSLSNHYHGFGYGGN